MKVAVLNTVLSNTGDAAIYESIVHALVQSGLTTPSDVVAFDSAADRTAPLYPEWQILQQPSRSSHPVRLVRAIASRLRGGLLGLLSRFPRATGVLLRLAPGTTFVRALRSIAAADLVVSSGGTYLVDHYDFGHRVAEIAFAKSRGKVVYLWTQSLGPFATPPARAAACALIPLVDGVFFRDPRSEQAWKAVGSLPARTEVCPDSVFSLYEADTGARDRRRERPIALLSVREWATPVLGESFSFTRYSAAMRAVARGLDERGWRCIAVSTCQGVEGYTIDDSATARNMFQGLSVEINSGFHTPGELMKLIRSADLVIATRMHMAIMSLISSTPVLALAYETKTLELFKSLAMPHCAVAIEEANAAWADQIVTADDPRNLAATLDHQALEDLRDRAHAPARAIADAMTRTAG
ncbi:MULTISPECIES: polysaccharide pyruvyl transferase family protein [Microbacterium]|uniref:Polysaccharide pyruvyl transferase domain-containing protein n=1 Tax=Microbacterium wangchenii TaxID=2541726 RepID=A0ABX5SRI5_9MICO|nr:MULTISPECIES: polysaccharide pyruvyl transferase family protein [Microbacterium]MCK6068100.1 polysaccharide pyruvyl transferase family protein [Microbacterium sp. EYE_512]QBR87778.1 hypothetical protein E4K62_03110 [Microbacterium wangchenii]